MTSQPAQFGISEFHVVQASKNICAQRELPIATVHALPTRKSVHSFYRLHIQIFNPDLGNSVHNFVQTRRIHNLPNPALDRVPNIELGARL
jgi:hypothetical protein